MSYFVFLVSALSRLLLMCATERVFRPNVLKLFVQNFLYSCYMALRLETFLLRRPTNTQKYKGAIFEQLKGRFVLRHIPLHMSVCQLKMKQSRKQDKQTRRGSKQSK